MFVGHSQWCWDVVTARVFDSYSAGRFIAESSEVFPHNLLHHSPIRCVLQPYCIRWLNILLCILYNRASNAGMRSEMHEDEAPRIVRLLTDPYHDR
jgi:hypothetical protein